MFDLRRGSGGLVSIAVHAAIIIGVVQGTARAKTAVRPRIIDVYPLPPADPPPATPRPTIDLPGVDAPSDPLPFPVVIVPGIPPIDSTVRFGAKRPEEPSGSLVGSDSAGGTGLYASGLVEEAPELLAGLPLRYPELLRQAGIEGRVIVELVVDTLGKAESGSLRVVTSTYPGFDRPALDAVGRALFRPGRVGGRAVRVLVRVPVEFHLRHER